MLVGYNLKHYRENRTFIVIEHYFILSIVCLLTFLKLKNAPTQLPRFQDKNWGY